MAVSRRLRFEVLRRDNHTCRYCGGAAPDVKLTVDHLTPVALGGGDEPGNLVTACQPCNAGKSSMPADAPLVVGVSDDAIRWAKAKAAAAEIQAANRKAAQYYHDAFLTEWTSWEIGPADNRHPIPLPSGYRESVDRFFAIGVEMGVIADSIRVAMTKRYVKDEFSYFCGIVYTIIRQREEIAAEMIRAEDAS